MNVSRSDEWDQCLKRCVGVRDHANRERLDCGPQWKDFLNYGEYNNPEGVSLEARTRGKGAMHFTDIHQMVVAR